MKKYLLILAMFMATTASADAVDDIINSKCDEIKEVTYASYINAQSGTPLSTTLVRLSTIYRDNQAMYKLASIFIGISYEMPDPAIDMSLQDAAKIVGESSKNACVDMLQEAISDMVPEDEDNPKVGA